MNIAILMMQKNEEELLDKWIAYHSYLVGHEHLFIFDNGSDSAITNQYLTHAKNQGCNVITSYSTKEDYENRGDIFCNYIKKLDANNHFDYYMLIDCDEFLASLDNEGVITCDKSALQLELQKYLNTDATLLIDSQFYNSSVSPYWFNKQPYRKCFFRRNTIMSLDQGFHWGKVKGFDSEQRTGIVHIHFHNKPYEVAKLHAAEKLRGRVNDFSLETLRNYRGKGFHLVRYFIEDEQAFIQNQIKLNHIPSSSLFYKLTELKQLWPYAQQVMESARTLGFADSGDGFVNQLRTFNGSIDNIERKETEIIISGWGIIRHSKPVHSVYLKLNDGQLTKLKIRSRVERSDVNKMLNVAGESLGFIASISIDDISSGGKEVIQGTLCTYLNFDRKYFDFDMRSHLREINWANETV